MGAANSNLVVNVAELVERVLSVAVVAGYADDGHLVVCQIDYCEEMAKYDELAYY